MSRIIAGLTSIIICMGTAEPILAQSDATREQAVEAMKRAASYFHDQVAVNGGYVYFYSPDLQRRLGEGVASPTEIWVQPPGTPTVGLAFIEAYKATGDKLYLTAATDAAEALTYGQLQSGAWTNSVEFDPKGKGVSQYRNGRGRGRNFSTLDDGISQGAIRLLMQVDKAHEFNHREVHESVQIALNALLAAQYPNGAFPQGWDETSHVDRQPVLQASFPKYAWRTEGRIKEYWDMYTLNDGAAGTVAATLIDAHAVYGHDRYLRALKGLGDFLVAAQMPAPQSGWAQQYSYDMHPIWARKFEPPAVAGRESQDVMKALMRIYEATGDDKYLAPIPAGIKYLKTSVLPEGLLARYYELQTNRPLYMSRRGDVYSLTYDDSNLPSHYGWKVENEISQIEAQYNELRRGRTRTTSSTSAADAQRIISSLENGNRWISTYAGERLIGQAKFRPGDRYLSSEVFSDNLTTLSRFISGP